MTSTPTRPVDNVIATKGLQDRSIYIIAGTTVENKGKLILPRDLYPVYLPVKILKALLPPPSHSGYMSCLPQSYKFYHPQMNSMDLRVGHCEAFSTPLLN